MHSRLPAWQKSPKFSKGWIRGAAETEREYNNKYYFNGVSYHVLSDLIVNRGHIGLRKNNYPFITLILDLTSEDVYLVKPIANKLRWSRFQSWSRGNHILLVWEGYNAQVLLNKCYQYLPKDGVCRAQARKAFTWIPVKGAEITEDEMSELLDNSSAYPLST